MKRLQDFSFQGKRVLLRQDLNVPLDKKGNITDDFRIEKAAPTIEYLLKQGAKVIVMSHLGEPGGKRVESLTLDRVQEKLQEHLARSIAKAKNCVGKDIEEWTLKMEPGEVLLLENLRFHPGEEENDRDFSSSLSRLGDIYLNDAFSASHRDHASTVGVSKFLPSAAGPLLEEEVATLARLLSSPPRPFLVIVGGKKAENKLSFVDAISDIADVVLLGNLLAKENVHYGANPFNSLKDNKGGLKDGKGSFPLSSFRNPLKVVLPLDGELDIGSKTLELFTRHIQKAKSIFWTGPLGQIEKEKYAKGSIAIAKAIGEIKVFSVAGGGDLVGFLRSHHLEDKFSYISPSGGAALAFLAGEQLPGLKALGYYDDDANIRMYTNDTNKQ